MGGPFPLPPPVGPDGSQTEDPRGPPPGAPRGVRDPALRTPPPRGREAARQELKGLGALPGAGRRPPPTTWWSPVLPSGGGGSALPCWGQSREAGNSAVRPSRLLTPCRGGPGVLAPSCSLGRGTFYLHLWGCPPRPPQPSVKWWLVLSVNRNAGGSRGGGGEAGPCGGRPSAYPPSSRLPPSRAPGTGVLAEQHNKARVQTQWSPRVAPSGGVGRLWLCPVSPPPGSPPARPRGVSRRGARGRGGGLANGNQLASSRPSTT